MTTWLSVIIALLVYVWTVFGLRPFFVQGDGELNTEQFKQEYPRQRWLPTLYAIASWLVFIVLLVGAPVLASALFDESVEFSAGAWLFVSGMNFFSGLCELMTGVCPTYGVLTKGHYRQGFIRHPAVRRLGAVRLLLSSIVVVSVWFIAQFE